MSGVIEERLWGGIKIKTKGLWIPTMWKHTKRRDLIGFVSFSDFQGFLDSLGFLGLPSIMDLLGFMGFSLSAVLWSS